MPEVEQCLIQEGWNCPACENKWGVPGIERDKFWIVNKADVAGYVSTVDCEISGITFETYGCMYNLCFHKDTPAWSEELVKAANAGSHYTQELTGRVIDGSSAILCAIENLVDVDVVIVIKDKNGNFYLLGQTGGITMTINTKTSGAATGDDTGDVITFTGINLGKAKKFWLTDEATTEVLLNSYLCAV